MPSPSRSEPSRAVTMAQLTENTEPPGGPTVMRLTHENAIRKVVRLTRNWFKQPDQAEAQLKAALVLYLREWVATYKQGVAESPSTVDRTILDIRRDTVVQILSEVGRMAVTFPPLTISADGSGTTGDRPPDGVPPRDL